MRHFPSTFEVHFFHKFRLVRLVSLVSFSKRMDPPGSVLFVFYKLYPQGFYNLEGIIYTLGINWQFLNTFFTIY